MRRAAVFGVLLAVGGALPCATAVPARAQNVVRGDDTAQTAAPIELSRDDVERILAWVPHWGARPDAPESKRVAARLHGQVRQVLEGWPLRPFHHTLGISGFEVEFAHPDQLFLALAISCPALEPADRQAVQAFLDERLGELPPYALDGFDPSAGRLRERYQVPEYLRSRRPTTAQSTLGVYAFWACCQYADCAERLPAHWPHIVTRMEPLLESGFGFDVSCTDYRQDEAQRLNGNVAGLIGCVRLARRMQDARVARQAAERLRQGLQLRVNLERVNPRFVEPTQSASNALHNFKLARYCDLVPELAELLRVHTEGLAEGRLAAFRETHGGWYLAFGDRLLGGENYTNALNFSRALFAGAALVERRPAAELAQYLDVPWCRGDLYFIEKCVYTLWAGDRWPVMASPGVHGPRAH